MAANKEYYGIFQVSTASAGRDIEFEDIFSYLSLIIFKPFMKGY